MKISAGRIIAIIIMEQTWEDTPGSPNFSGMYTYDGVAGAFEPGWAIASAYDHANGSLWAPSVAPGYIDDRAVPGNTTPTIDRNNGVAYDQSWNLALSPQNGQPDWITITLFNEWHEGTQIEPASNTPPGGFGYLTYNNAYGLTGTAAEQAYLTRTKHWVDIFDPQGSTLPGAASNLKATAGNGQISLTWSAGTNTGSGACVDMNDITGELQLCAGATGAWQHLSGTWNSGSNTTITVRAITDGTPNAGSWFDDITLTPQ